LCKLYEVVVSPSPKLLDWLWLCRQKFLKDLGVRPYVVRPDKVCCPDAIAVVWPHPAKVTAARVSSRNANNLAVLFSPIKVVVESVKCNVLGTVVTCAVSNLHVWMLFGFFIH